MLDAMRGETLISPLTTGTLFFNREVCSVVAVATYLNYSRKARGPGITQPSRNGSLESLVPAKRQFIIAYLPGV
jgi:hypothetical protein